MWLLTMNGREASRLAEVTRRALAGSAALKARLEALLKMPDDQLQVAFEISYAARSVDPTRDLENDQDLPLERVITPTALNAASAAGADQKAMSSLYFAAVWAVKNETQPTAGGVALAMGISRATLYRRFKRSEIKAAILYALGPKGKIREQELPAKPKRTTNDPEDD